MKVFEVSKSEIKEKIKDGCRKCGICGDQHFYRDCKYVTVTRKIKNKEVPTRARLSLPNMLEIKKFADESSSVFTRSLVEVGTEFGPFIAKKNLTLNPLTTFPIKIFIENESDLSEYYLDTTDENECCWMMFVNPANDVEEQNLICYQEGENIFFGSIMDINPGEELRVWYSPHYAFKMQKSTLSFKESSNLQMEINRNGTDDLNTLIKQQQKIVPRVIWNCKFCYKLEENVTDFARHLMSHYSLQKRKRCEHCAQRFRYTQDYRQHVKLHHNDSLDIKDIPAKYLHVKNKVDKHLTNKSPIVLKSNTIGGPLLLQFLSDSLDNSNLLMQQPEVNSLEIENYENQNILLDSENLHLNVDVIGNHSIKDLEDSSSEMKTKELEAQEIICDICLRKFRSLKAISTHLKLHIGEYFCSSCKKVFGRPENLKQHKCNQIFSLKCPKCEKIFYQKKYLAKHMSVVHDKKYTCIVCKKFYYSSTELRNHICQKVPKGKMCEFMCKLCSKKFSKEIYLKKHLRIHSTVKDKEQTVKQICSKCCYIFYSKRSYERHLISVHNKSRDYECHICDKRFSRKDVLHSHMINVHMLTPEKINKCMQCNKEFKSERSLTFHVKVAHSNSQYRCHCGAVFKYSRNLLRHRNKLHKTDTDILSEDMHQCPICTTKVKLKRSLQRHIRQKHPDEYKNICVEINAKKEEKKKLISRCPICHHAVKSVLSLKTHILKKHPKDYRYICTDLNITKDALEKQKKDTKLFDDDFDNFIDTDQKCMDLQKTIENMDFSIDACNDNLLSGSETIDKFLKESSEQISILFTDSPKVPTVNDFGTTVITDRISNREVCLSMPDISEIDQEIKLSKTSFISDTGNIVETQEDLTNIVVYVVKEKTL